MWTGERHADKIATGASPIPTSITREDQAIPIAHCNFPMDGEFLKWRRRGPTQRHTRCLQPAHRKPCSSLRIGIILMHYRHYRAERSTATIAKALDLVFRLLQRSSAFTASSLDLQ